MQYSVFIAQNRLIYKQILSHLFSTKRMVEAILFCYEGSKHPCSYLISFERLNIECVFYDGRYLIMVVLGSG